MRSWSNLEEDEGSIHAMGNGAMIAYAQGPDISRLYGPPYSSPEILNLHVEFADVLIDEANRYSGTAIWHHRLSTGKHLVAEYTEYMVSGIPAYIRKMKCYRNGMRWMIRFNEDASILRWNRIPNSWLAIIQPGSKIFGVVFTLWSYHWILPTGSIVSDLDRSGNLVLNCNQGEGDLIIIGSYEYALGVNQVAEIIRCGTESLLEDTKRYWESFSFGRLKPDANVGSSTPAIQEVLDSASVMIKSEQSHSGGAHAAHCYPLSYIRDQYGGTRGMISLGMLYEVEQSLLFRFRKFKHFGDLKSAEVMGSDSSRNAHENDEVEGPSYILLQARDYLKAGGENDFIRSLWPMLEWCWNVQLKHLVDGMLPFNGDETYIAGDFYPKSGLYQGSADATLAFATAGQWLVPWAISQGFWTDASQLSAVYEAKSAYRKYFLHGDGVWANAPERETMVTPPRFRFGQCEGQIDHKLISAFYEFPRRQELSEIINVQNNVHRELGLVYWHGWTERSDSGRYLCPLCMNRNDILPNSPERTELNCVTLLPMYLGSDIISRSEVTRMLDRISQRKLQSGCIRTAPDKVGFVGYDPGLLLINMVATKHPGAREAYELLLRIIDRANAWNEYYEDNGSVKEGCGRANLWSTGINIEAVITYLERTDKHKMAT